MLSDSPLQTLRFEMENYILPGSLNQIHFKTQSVQLWCFKHLLLAVQITNSQIERNELNSEYCMQFDLLWIVHKETPI